LNFRELARTKLGLLYIDRLRRDKVDEAVEFCKTPAFTRRMKRLSWIGWHWRLRAEKYLDFCLHFNEKEDVLKTRLEQLETAIDSWEEKLQELERRWKTLNKAADALLGELQVLRKKKRALPPRKVKAKTGPSLSESIFEVLRVANRSLSAAEVFERLPDAVRKGREVQHIASALSRVPQAERVARGVYRLREGS